MTAGPFVFIGRYGVPTEAYSYYFDAVVFASMQRGLAANRLVRRVRTELIEAAAYVFSILGIALLAGLAFVGRDNAYSVTAALSSFGLGISFTNALAPILILESAGDLPKSAVGALAGSSQLVAASVRSFTVAVMAIMPLWSMIAVMSRLLRLVR